MLETQSYMINPGHGVLLTEIGVSPANVLRRAQLPADLFARGSIRVKAADYMGLWRAIEEEVDDPTLPIRIGQAISVEVFDPPIFAALCSPDLNVASERIALYKPLVGSLRVGVTRTPERTTLTLEWPSPTVPPTLLASTDLVFWVALARLGTRARVHPVRVTSPHPPEATEAYRDYLGVPITGGPEYSVAFSAVDAARPFVTANAPIWEFFEPELQRRLSTLQQGASASERVGAALLELLPIGQGTVQAVAHQLALSPRTLQRQLNAEATTFQAVLNGTRESLARHYLRESHMSTAEIAFLLGYEEPSSFYRAFHAWTGQTPERVRLAAV